MLNEERDLSLFPYGYHLEHTYGSDMCALNIELIKMRPEILLIEKRDIEMLDN